MEGRDRMRFAVAIYFLNKDVEQLLQVRSIIWLTVSGIIRLTVEVA